MKKIFCIFLFLFASAYASELKLKEKLAEARPGSYLVIEQNKTFTFFHVHELSKEHIILEEVSIPAASFSRNPTPWKAWFEKGAPGHTSWLMSRVSMETGIFEETFSFTHQGWVDMSSANPFFTTLLNLTFHEVPLQQRRRVGLPPGHNKADNRPLWNPRLVVSGTPILQIPFFAYKARWPADGSELSRKAIEIYLPTAPNSQDELWYPVYFPYWMEVEGKFGNAKIRVVDSGLDAHSPKKTFPKRHL